MDDVKVKLDEDNTLRFRLKIAGVRSRDVTVRTRLVCETADFSCVFPAFVDEDDIVVKIPPMREMIKEGTYNTTLEVLVGDRMFVPLKMTTSFEHDLIVVAEAVQEKTPLIEQPRAEFVEIKSSKDDKKDKVTRIAKQINAMPNKEEMIKALREVVNKK